MSLLTIDQQNELVEFIIEDFGIGLDRDQFTDAALQMFEDIAGFDSTDESEVQFVINCMENLYDQH